MTAPQEEDLQADALGAFGAAQQTREKGEEVHWGR